MSGSAPASHSQPGAAESPAEVWHRLLRPDVELAPAFLAELNARMRAERLTFGERIHCPFLRPFFLTAEDEQRVRTVAESIAALGERVVKQSLADPRLLAQSALSPEEERLARINPRYATSSTASRLDAFLLPRFAAVCGIQCGIARGTGLCGNSCGCVSYASGDATIF